MDYGVGTSPLSVAIGDLDADGKPEVTVANYASNNLTILKRNDLRCVHRWFIWSRGQFYNGPQPGKHRHNRP